MRKANVMLKFLSIPALLLLAACGGVGQPSQGISATYDQTSSRAAFDRLVRQEPQCHNHRHLDNCSVKTEVRNHVSPIRGVSATHLGRVTK